MDTDLFNPARKYKEFRPRMASRGSKATGVPTNRATVSLYNNSTGTYVLAVRDFTVAGTAADSIALSYQPGQIGSSQGLVASFLPTDAIQAGLIASVDTLTVYAADYTVPLNTTGEWEWFHEFPFAVISPGFSLVWQCGTAAHAIVVSAVWEAIQIDQLDYFF